MSRVIYLNEDRDTPESDGQVQLVTEGYIEMKVEKVDRLSFPPRVYGYYLQEIFKSHRKSYSRSRFERK